MRPSVSAADDLERQQGEQPTPEEKALLREEFITQMHQRFLDGKDKDFDYRLVTPPLIALSQISLYYSNITETRILNDLSSVSV